MIPEDQKNTTTQWCSTGRRSYHECKAEFTLIYFDFSNRKSSYSVYLSSASASTASPWFRNFIKLEIWCTRKQQPRFYWSCSSVVMNDATPPTPPSAWVVTRTIKFHTRLSIKRVGTFLYQTPHIHIGPDFRWSGSKPCPDRQGLQQRCGFATPRGSLASQGHTRRRSF